MVIKMRAERKILALVGENEIGTIANALSGRYEVERVGIDDTTRLKAGLLIISARFFGNFVPFCENFRKTSDIPIIVIARSHSVPDILEGLSVGDDSVPPDCPPGELLARVDAKTRSARSIEDGLSLGRLTLDAVTCEATIGREKIQLTRREFAILFCLASRPDATVSREELVKAAGLPAADSNVLWLTVSRLKQKLSPKRTGISITAVRGLGYRLEEL